MQIIRDIQRPGIAFFPVAFVIGLATLFVFLAPYPAVARAPADQFGRPPVGAGDAAAPAFPSHRALPSWWLAGTTRGIGSIDAGSTAAVDHATGLLAPNYRPIFQAPPDLVISKRDDEDPVSAGGFLAYTILITNVSDLVANNVRVTETYDANVTYVGSDPPPDVGQNIWTFDTLTRGESARIDLTVEVADCMPSGSILVNTVEVGAPSLEGSADSEATAVTSAPDLTATLDDQPDPVAAGDTLNYQISYGNQGNAPATGVGVALLLHGDLRYLTLGTSDPPPSSEGADGFNWAVGDLSCGETADIDVTMVVADVVEDQTPISAEAWMESSVTYWTQYDTEETLINAPVLALAKTASSSVITPGERLRYTLVFSNVGHADSSALLVTDTLPVDTDFVDCEPSPCVFSEGVVTWEPGSLAAGAGETAALEVDVREEVASSTLINKARVREFDSEARTAFAQTETAVAGLPSLQLSISNGRDSVEAGDRLVYTIRYANTGKGVAKETIIVATPPSSDFVRDVSCKPKPGYNCFLSSGQVRFEIDKVSTGASGSVELIATVRDPLPSHARNNSIEASATIYASGPTGSPEDTFAVDRDPIATRPDLVVKADYDQFMPQPGKRVTYTLKFSNAGQIDTVGVYVDAVRHPNTQFDETASSAKWQRVGDRRYRHWIGPLDADETGQLLFVVTLNNDPFSPDTTDFDAVFFIRDDGLTPDAEPEDNDFYAPLGVPNLIIGAAQAEPQVWSGQPGWLYVDVKNIGSGTACGVYNPNGCTPFALDAFIDVMVPPPSFPILTYGDCYVWVDAIDAGVKTTVQISFTLDAGLSLQPGYCLLSAGRGIDNIWLKVDNWQEGAPPYPAEFGLVPESDEHDNVFGPVVSNLTFLPILLHGY